MATPKGLTDPAAHAAHDQIVRRAEILAATRRILAAAQDERFTIRRIADECGVTTQTIHNNFGSRHELLASAINEHTNLIDRKAHSLSNAPVMFLELAKLYYRCAQGTPDFLRNMVLAAFSPRWPLMALLQTYSTSTKGDFLRQMGRRGLLRDSVDAEMLAAQITRINTISIYDWAQHRDARQMYRQIVDGVSLLLLGALESRSVSAVEKWLASEQAELAGSQGESYGCSPRLCG